MGKPNRNTTVHSVSGIFHRSVVKSEKVLKSMIGTHKSDTHKKRATGAKRSLNPEQPMSNNKKRPRYNSKPEEIKSPGSKSGGMYQSLSYSI